MRIIVLTLLLIGVVLYCTACTLAPQSAIPLPNIGPDLWGDPIATINASEKRWRSLNISNYELSVHFYSYGIEVYTHLVVVDGRVSSKSCQNGTMFGDRPRQCDSFIQHPEQYTVPELFATARGLLESFSKSNSDANKAPSLDFDLWYRYPTRMRWQLFEPGEYMVTGFKANP